MKFRKLQFILALLLSTSAVADTIAIIGTGNVGGALGVELALQGHTIVYGSRSPQGLKATDLVKKTSGNPSTSLPKAAVVDADIVVLAVPGMVVLDVVAGLGDLSGKIIIDATNPLVVDEPIHFTFGVATSNGEMVQAAAPEAFVVKAFNTVTWQSMLDPGEEDGPLYVPVVGNNDNAKARVAEFVRKMGLVAIDLGPIEVAHWTEYGVVVSLNNQFSERSNYDLVFREID